MMRVSMITAVAALANGANATQSTVYDCIVDVVCVAPESCEAAPSGTSAKIIARDDGLAFLDLRLGRVDMKELSSFGDTRRDWVIQANPRYSGLLTLYANGDLALSDHGETALGDPKLGMLRGNCEVGG